MKRDKNKVQMMFFLMIMMCSNVTAQIFKDKDRQIVYESLKHYWYCKVMDCDRGNPFPDNIPYHPNQLNDSARIELLRILENNLTEEYKQELAKLSVRKFIETEISNLTKSRKNPELLPRHKKSLQKRLDSLTKITQIKADTFPPYQQAVAKRGEEISRIKIDNNLILVSGLTDDRRYVPILLKVIGDSISYDQAVVELALARFKEEPFHLEMINRFTFNEEFIKEIKGDHFKLGDYFSRLSRNLTYISSQESLLELSKFLPTELKVTDKRAINMGDVGYSPVSRQAFEMIVEKLNNTEIKQYIAKHPKSFNVFGKFNVPQETAIEKKHVLFLQKWMKDNYGQYEIKRD